MDVFVLDRQLRGAGELRILGVDCTFDCLALHEIGRHKAAQVLDKPEFVPGVCVCVVCLCEWVVRVLRERERERDVHKQIYRGEKGRRRMIASA